MSGAAWHTFRSVLLLACWGAFGVVWTAGALYNARRGPRVRERASRDWSWVVAVAAVWLLYGDPAGVDWESLSLSSPWIRAPGIALLVLATAFTLWARLTLGTMWSSFVVAKNEHELRTDGPYAITRHPIYTGLAGMVLGTALVSDLGRAAAVFVFGVGYVAVKARAEERLLGGVFPEYESYRRRVPRLIPRLSGSLRPPLDQPKQ
jgi:protein-S-isoprenylcysteine O-methyltransferase Ste14